MLHNIAIHLRSTEFFVAEIKRGEHFVQGLGIVTERKRRVPT